MNLGRGNTRMSSTRIVLVRLFVLTLVGALVGYNCSGLLVVLKVSQETRAASGVAEKIALNCAVIGAFIGVAAEVFLRLVARPKWRFSLRELLGVATIMAVALCTIAALFHWANASGD